MWGVFLEAHFRAFPLCFLPIWGEIIQSSGGPRHLSTIPLKDSYLFKMAESVISFCLKIFSNSAILNRWESFSRMVDHVTCLPWGPYNFSHFRENFLVGPRRKHLCPAIYFLSSLHNQTHSKKVFISIFPPKFSIYSISPSNKYTLIVTRGVATLEIFLWCHQEI